MEQLSTNTDIYLIPNLSRNDAKTALYFHLYGTSRTRLNQILHTKMLNKTTQESTPNDDNVANILKVGLGYASFENRDIGGKMFAILDSVSDDIIHSGHVNSDITDELISELAGLIKDENSELEGRALELEDEVEEEIPELEVEDLGRAEDDNEEEEDEDDGSEDEPVLRISDEGDEADPIDDDDDIIPRDDSDDDDSEEELKNLLNKARQDVESGDRVNG